MVSDRERVARSSAGEWRNSHSQSSCESGTATLAGKRCPRNSLGEYSLVGALEVRFSSLVPDITTRMLLAVSSRAGDAKLCHDSNALSQCLLGQLIG